MHRILTVFMCLVVPAPAVGQDLAWPDGAALVQNNGPQPGHHLIARGPYADGNIPTARVEGAVRQQVWHIPATAGAPIVVLDLLRTQLRDQGYDIGFTCADRVCGGFDFRYGLPIAEGPDMHVDLGDFQYLTAQKHDGADTTTLALTLSRGGQHTYAHLAMVAPPGARGVEVTPSTRAEPAATTTDDLIATLRRDGHAPLDDLTFDPGSATLANGVYGSLGILAGFLAENPTRRIVLVGHSDAVGPLDPNLSLSRARAWAVRDALVNDFGADAGQITAQGIGFLSPRAPNTTEQGRTANRRVEAVLIDAE